MGLEPSRSWNWCVYFDWTVCIVPAALCRCFCLVLRRCLRPVSEHWNGSLPPWEWIFAFLADILSRPLGVGCYSISQLAWCNYTKILQSLFVERVRALAPEPKPLRRTVWDRAWTKVPASWRDCGKVLGGLISPINSCQCLESSLNFQDSVFLRRSMPCGQSFPERDGRRGGCFISLQCFGKILIHDGFFLYCYHDTQLWLHFTVACC